VAERSFKEEVKQLQLGDGETFEGEGILAVTKGLLQAGVSYVGGYQGAPISHLIDVLHDGQDILTDLGIHVESSGNEAAAAAMLGASINYPIRGAVGFKSTVGTNVASDALSNLSSAGVIGGALIVLGEDYGEGSAIIQERSHAFAMKSQMWLLDPRPNLETVVNMVEKGFELSEASNTPVMLELRIRACHVTGRFKSKTNKKPLVSSKTLIENPDFDFSRICLPPATFAQEKQKIEVRWPAAIKYLEGNKLNELFNGPFDEVGIITQGGHFNGVMRALELLGLADSFGNSKIPIYCLNVTYPLIPSEVAAFAAGKRAILVVEEGQPAYLEDAICGILRRSDLNTTVVGKQVFPLAGDYNGATLVTGIGKFLEGSVPKGVDLTGVGKVMQRIASTKPNGQTALGAPVPARPPAFCTGCPERPVLSALKLVERDLGKIHVSADVGCHTMSTIPPFNIGNTMLGYGLGLSSSTGIAPSLRNRVISLMGDGGFWHGGLSSGVANHVFNRSDGILVIFKNGYSSATGHQNIPSSGVNGRGEKVEMDIVKALKGVGVTWIRTVRSYSVGTMMKTLKEAMATRFDGLKVIIADGECQLARQRRIKPEIAKQLADGQRVVRTRFGVDHDVCTGDHSCIRLSGCPSLTIKPNPDPLRTDPVASVIESCVGCGLCGEVAHAAVLCPSFYRAEIVQNPTVFDRLIDRIRRRVIRLLQSWSQPVFTT
jgi:indolepyruvate ferredoxin oxidoreductase alpha subunit